ncbi:MAG: hypothetical protein R3B09_28575 [Nannocystaceae bacterium]
MRRPTPQRLRPSPSGDLGRRFAALALVAAPLACAHTPRGSAAPEAWSYTIRDEDEGTRWSVELCFEGPRPSTLFGRESAAEAILEARDPARGEALPIDREAGRIDLTGLTGPCLGYDVDLAAASFGWNREVVRGGGGARLVATSLWMWAPALYARDPVITVRFATAPEVVVSTPWARSAGAPAAFTPDATVNSWGSYVALGPEERLRPLEVEVAGGALEVVTVGDARISDEGIRRWLGAAGSAVAELYGSLPAERIQVVLVPLGTRDDAVLFGAAERGGGPSVYLLISAEAPDDAFVGEWVSIHELLHLGMPPIQRADAWLPEGFVTYYTEVVRARSGLRSSDAALRALDDGFGRGRADVRGGTLGEASRKMGRMHAYSWVYWGGAAIALLVDVALRSDGRSLDDGLRHLHRCCARTMRRWSADEALAELDTWAGSDQISSLVARVLATPGFDELATIYGKLGLSMVNATLALDDDAPLAPVRRAIFARP